MIEAETIKIQKTTESRLPGINFDELKFGRTFSDHMFHYGLQGWKLANAYHNALPEYEHVTSVLGYSLWSKHI